MSFIFGGNTGQTYEGMKRQRELANMLLKRSNGMPKTAIEGINMALDDVVGMTHKRRADKTEKAGREAFGQSLSGVMGGESGISDIVGLLGNPYASSGQQAVLAQMLDRKMNPPKRETAKGADGRLRYIDDGSFVFENMELPAPKRDTEIHEGRLIDTQTGEVIADLNAAPTDGVSADPKAEADLRKEFSGLPAVKAFAEQAQAFERVKASAAQDSGAGDMAMIFNYMKVLDPGSTVREGEFAAAAESGSFGSRVMAAVERLKTGKRLTPEMRQDFLDTASRLYLEAEQGHNRLYDQYSLRAEGQNLSPETALNDFRYRESGAPAINRGPARPNPRTAAEREDFAGMSDEELAAIAGEGDPLATPDGAITDPAILKLIEKFQADPKSLTPEERKILLGASQ